jgi:EpsG family
MLLYLSMLATPLLQHLITIRLGKTLKSFFWIFVWLFFTIIIGGRYEIGSDWSNYLLWYEFARDNTFLDTIASSSDPGYITLNWLCARMNLGIQGVNMVCGAIFMYALIKYCNRQAMPWLSFYIAVPYLVIIVVMGYSRQGVAIGIFLLALIKLNDRQGIRFLVILVLAALFHKSVIFMGILLFSGNQYSRVARIGLLGLFLLLFISFTLSSAEFWMTNYMGNGMESEGALLRVFLNSLPVMAALPFLKQLSRISPDLPSLKWMGILSMVSIPILLIPQLNVGSTSIDRMALYLIPLQLAIWPRLVCLLRSNTSRWILVTLILGMYATILIVWMIFSAHNINWYPYKFSLTEL